MGASVYHTTAWAQARRAALARDGNRCTVSRLLGGDCHGALHVHHITPLASGGTHTIDNLGTVCATHHPMWEALRRKLSTLRAPRRCPHHHVHAEARRLCEQRLNAA